MNNEMSNGGKGNAPALSRAYHMDARFTDEERLRLQGSGINPDDYAVALCPTVVAPQAAQPLQVVPISDPATGAQQGSAVLFLLPVLVPLHVPAVASGLMGPDGKPMQASMHIEGPPGALARVIVPRASLTSEATAELEAVEAHFAGQDPSPDAQDSSTRGVTHVEGVFDG